MIAGTLATPGRSWGIGAKLGMGFGTVILLMLVILLVALLRMTTLVQTTEQITGVEWHKAEAANVLAVVAAENARRTVQQMVATPKERAALRDEIVKAREEFLQASDYLKTHVQTSEGLAALAKLEEVRQRYTASLQSFYEFLDTEHDVDAGTELVEQTLPLLLQLQQIANQIGEMSKKNAQTSGEKVVAQAYNARWLVTIIGAVAVLLGVLMAWRMTRGIVQPLHAAVQVAQSVAAGQLDQQIRVTSRDELGRLQQALATMSASLQKIVGEVREGSEQIAIATEQIAGGNMNLSTRTDEQASALQQTSAAMQQLSSTVQHNLENSRYAANLATTASQVATQGGEVVQQAVQTMHSIHASSRRIGDIIGIIEGIAFQTNILALNAAVEAARAGEQGRGFAVVAAEVRSLAGRSADAAKQIRQLILESSSSVEVGGELVEKAGASMQDIVKRVHEVAQLVAEISRSSEEQNTGLQQIQHAVVQMDAVTQQNAALVEEAASASQSLLMQAQGLVKAVSVFRVRGEERLQIAVQRA